MKRTLWVALLSLASMVHAQEPKKAALLVFAAASLTQVLEELSREFERASGVTVKLSFAASSALARQIESGAKADVFVSADQEWMNYLDERKFIAAATRRNLVGNRLVLIAPADSRIALKIAPGFALAASLGDGRLATADPDTVPAGRYARAALTALGAWDGVESRLARGENVRTAMMYVARGEAPLGIVYATDAKVDPKVRIVDTFPGNSHPPITYPAAATNTGQPEALEYLEFLASRKAAESWQKFGFLKLPK